MLINPQYQFSLYAGKDGQSKTVHPLFDANTSVEIERESGQQFFRRKLGNKIKFIREDYDWILAQPFDTKFELAIARLAFLSGVPNWLRCSFSLVDCTVNEDDKSIEVQPATMDEYTDVLAGLDREFNLIKLAPEIERVLLQKRPLIQIYNAGDNIVSCFFNGMTWEQDCEAVNDETELTETYLFAKIDVTQGERVILISGEITPAEAAGRYMGNVNENRYENENGYYITAIDLGFVTNKNKRFQWNIYSPDGSLLGFYTDLRLIGLVPDPAGLDAKILGLNFPTIQCEERKYVYGRYLHDVASKGQPIPTDDIIENNRNYRYASGYNISDTVVISYNSTDQPTEYGKTIDGRYFAPPYTLGGQKFYPLAQSEWGIGSIWFAFHSLDRIIEEDYRKTYVLRDSYPLSSVLAVLLREVSPNITHEATPEYSEFLYGLNGDPISGKEFRINFTQKTNILRGDYQVPAQKVPITLQTVFDFLRDTFRCFWFVENGKLRIEHISFFYNGGSYDTTPEISHDLTQMLNSRNGKSWGFATNNYTFDKPEVPERYTFAWADDVTSEFEGRPIEVLSSYVEAGRTEDITIANMTSDIDYMLLAPEQISEDGFVVMATVKANAIDKAPEGVAFVSATDTLTDKWTLRPECTGTNGVLTFRMWGGGSAAVSFFDEENNELSRSDVFEADDSVRRVSIYVPTGATSVAFLAFGTIYASISSLRVEGMRELPFVDYRADGVDYALQNGYMAFSVLQPSYWRYNMPAPRLKINGEETDAVTVKRIKSQTVSFPAGKEGVNPQKNIRTALGVGAVSKISLSLLSNIAKTTLKYVPE